MEEFKLYEVSGKYVTGTLDAMMYFSYTLDTPYDFKKLTVAKTLEGAIASVNKEMLDETITFSDALEKTRKKIQQQEEIEGKQLNMKERSKILREYWRSQFTPDIPCYVSRWRAEEITISGYKIVIEPSS